MLPYKRSQRVGHLLRKELSDIIMNRMKDPRLGFLTVTEVDLTQDLKLARVYVSVMRQEERQATMEALESSRAFIRAELAGRLSMRAVPSLEFKLDTTSEYGENIERLLRKLREES